jgi:hypothetical protein
MKLADKIEAQRARKAALAEVNAWYDERRNEVLRQWETGQITYEAMCEQWDAIASNFHVKYDVLMGG